MTQFVYCGNCHASFFFPHACPREYYQPVPHYEYYQQVPYYDYYQPVPQVLPFWDDVMPCGCKWNSLTGESRICRLHWQEFKKNES